MVCLNQIKAINNEYRQGQLVCIINNLRLPQSKNESTYLVGCNLQQTVSTLSLQGENFFNIANWKTFFKRLSIMIFCTFKNNVHTFNKLVLG